MQSLSDPKNDRVVTTIKAPPIKPLSTELIWENPRNPSNLTRQIKLENDQK